MGANYTIWSFKVQLTPFLWFSDFDFLKAFSLTKWFKKQKICISVNEPRNKKITVLNFWLGRRNTVFIFALGIPTTVLNFGFGSRTAVLNLGLGSPTTLLNFGFGSRTTAMNFQLGSETTQFSSGFGSQTTVLNFGLGSQTRSESSNVSLVVLDKLPFDTLVPVGSLEGRLQDCSKIILNFGFSSILDSEFELTQVL